MIATVFAAPGSHMISITQGQFLRPERSNPVNGFFPLQPQMAASPPFNDESAGLAPASRASLHMVRARLRQKSTSHQSEYHPLSTPAKAARATPFTVITLEPLALRADSFASVLFRQITESRLKSKALLSPWRNPSQRHRAVNQNQWFGLGLRRAL